MGREIMGWLIELLVYVFARPILGGILALFDYDPDWEPKDGHQTKGWRLVFAALSCCAVSVIVLGGLIWLIWLFSR
jgi:hypothetical protein